MLVVSLMETSRTLKSPKMERGQGATAARDSTSIRCRQEKVLATQILLGEPRQFEKLAGTFGLLSIFHRGLIFLTFCSIIELVGNPGDRSIRISDFGYRTSDI